MALGAFSPLPLRLGGSIQDGWTPEQHARFCADLVATKRMAPLFWAIATVGVSVATVDSYRGQNGDGLAFAPTATWIGIGNFTLDFTNKVFTDAFGVSEPISVRYAVGTATTALLTRFTNDASTKLSVRLHDATGATANGTICILAW